MKDFLNRFRTEQAGTVSVEYVLIACAITVGLAPLIYRTGGVTAQLYEPLAGYFASFAE
jgi:Flp pilus assembly pilin Flp